MKKILPFSVWVNGQQVICNYLYFGINNDNMNSNATFYWCLYNQIDANNFGNKIIDGNLIMDGTDYQSFNSSSNSNQYAQNWIAQQLGVTIIP